MRGAWPARGRAPRTHLARWLARQVGSAKPRPCAKHWRKARRRCGLRKRGRGHRRAGAAASAAAVDTPLKLVRSYEIPVDDPSYNRLLNWSWTYDSAVSAAAFAASHGKANSAQLLDQLAALQHTDGSIEIAFNVASGEAQPTFRAGVVAWLGLAATAYDRAFRTDRYLDSERRAADYLLSLQGASGLIRGGPDVKWSSTQHNLVAYSLLVRLAGELRDAGNKTGAGHYEAAAARIAAAVNANLLVSEHSGAHFRQGLGDDTLALDVQALGAMYLEGTGESALATRVLAYAQETFAIAGRSIVESADPATYNLTYSAKGPFSGYTPYAGTGAPDVLWAQGSGQMRLAKAALGQDTKNLDKSIANWAKVSKKQGPLQANETIESKPFGVEYHVWPASTTAAWTLLAEKDPEFFAVPPG